MRPTLPSGTVTFLFSDIEGSTRLLHELGSERYAALLMRHRAVMRTAFAAGAGVEVGTEGDSFFVAFPTAPGALGAAMAAQRALAALPIRVRMGIHTGSPDIVDGGYVGMDVHRAARIAAVGHGGQILVSAAAATLTGTEGLRDLGNHRLKDLAAPERLWQVGAEGFPPLRSLHQTNLPIAPTPFLGRERELKEVGSLLGDDATRIVTLTGPGGTGKTRLAMQAAAEAAERYPQGVWWVPLDALRQPDLVLPTAAAALGAKGGFAEHVGDRAMLIVFDNFEQVIEAASAMAGVLAACAHLDLLVTSREPLRIRGEREYAVPPLAHAEATRLFVERAQELGLPVTADNDVSEICRRLDDLPLAIELAVARLKVLSPAQIAKRLEQRLPVLTSGARDVPARQRTLHAAIEWSHELLTPDEQRLFAQLAVFRGGFTLEAAEAVGAADLDLLQSLVDKSLVRHEGDRFSMLETIREYAAERLAASGEEAAARRRHADYFIALAKEAEPAILSPRPEEWLDRLERDHDNLRASFDALEALGETQRGLELGGTVWELWCLRGHLDEGLRRLDRLLALDDRPTRARAKALTGAAHIAPGLATDRQSRRERAERALGLHRMVGDAWDIAFAEYEYAGTLTDVEEFASARPLFEESVRRFREIGDEHRELQAMRMLAWSCEQLGDEGLNRSIQEEVLRRARAIGDRENAWYALSNHANIATREGRHADAVAHLAEAFAVARDFGDPGMVDMTVTRFGRALAFAGAGPAAAEVLSAAEAEHARVGWTYPGWFAKMRDEALARVHALLDDAAFRASWERGRTLTPEQAVARATGELGSHIA